MEADFQAIPSTVSLDSLLFDYQKYITTFPNDKAQIASYRKNAKSILDERLEELRKTTFNETTGVINQAAALELIELAKQYALLLPDDPKAPDWLYQAGEVAGALHDYDTTLTLFQKVNDQYPNYEKASQVLFMRAFTLDNELKRYEEARPLYQEFLQKYPNDEFADDAQFLLENLGKSEEEIIRSFQEKQNQ